VDTPYGNVREYPAFGPPARRNQAASRVFDEGDWNEAVDWCVGWDNRTNDTYDLAVRHFSTGGDLMMVGIIPLFNEQFIDLGA
jgi:allantoicase